MSTSIIIVFTLCFSLMVWKISYLQSEINKLKKLLYKGKTPSSDIALLLHKLKPIPSFSDLDNNDETLKSLLATIKIENWGYTIRLPSGVYDNRYDIVFYNDQKKAKFSCGFRKEENRAKIVLCCLYYGDKNVISFSYDNNHELVINFMWSYIEENNNKKIDIEKKRLEELKKDVDNTLLKSAKRDDKLNKLL